MKTHNATGTEAFALPPRQYLHEVPVGATPDHADGSTDAGTAPIRAAMITNIPAPYRIPVLDRLARDPRVRLHVYYAARREPEREWDLPALEHEHSFLRENFRARPSRTIHNNPDVWRELRRLDPEVVVTNGFNPTHLYAFFYAWLWRRAHVTMTDGTLVHEQSLSALHRLVRRIVFARSHASIVASEGGRALLHSYGVPDDRIHLSPLCANPAMSWESVVPCSPGLDFLFSGRLIDTKNPVFALEVAHGVARRTGRRIRLAVLGSGPLQQALQLRAAQLGSEVELVAPGHVSQADVPAWFASARVFLFPSSWDAWGVVANEACHAGVPVIVTPHAGVAGELIRDGVNGYVRPLDLDSWIEAATRLIESPELRADMSSRAMASVQAYSADSAARGIAEAVRAAAAAHGRTRRRARRKAVSP